MRTKTLRTGAGMRGAKTPQVVRFQPRPTLAVMIVTNLTRLTCRLARWLLGHAAIAGLICGLIICPVVFGWIGSAAAAVALGFGLLPWWRLQPNSFRGVIVSRW